MTELTNEMSEKTSITSENKEKLSNKEATTTITNSSNLVFSIGGANDPKCVITLPNCHLEVPAHSIEDVISLETTFHALPTDIDSADEASILYSG